MSKKQVDEDTVIKCKNEIAKRYAEIKRDAWSRNKRVAKGRLEEIIAEVKAEHGVTEDIRVQAMRRRVQKGRIECKHSGVVSPVEEAEQLLVPIFIQMCKIRQPLSVHDGVKLMNSLIKDTPIQQRLIQFQKSRKLGNDGFEYGTLGYGWWYGF